MKDFRKTIVPGSVKEGNAYLGNIFISIDLSDGRLSISGVVGPKYNGDASGPCGQIDTSIVSYMTRDEITYADGWDADMLTQLLEVWDEYHLNDMQAGTPAQTKIIRDNRDDFTLAKKENPILSWYDWAKATLREHDLLIDPHGPDGDYLFGSAWLSIKVPNEALEFLKGLPDSQILNPWKKF